MFSLFGRPRAFSFLASASVAAIVSSLQPAAAQEQARAFNIPPQPLSSALIEFSAQSDTRVIADPALVNGRRSPGVVGSFAPDQALQHILAGTGLRLSRNDGGGLSVIGESASPTQLGANERAAPSDEAADLVVTGTRLRTAVNGFPVSTYSRERMEESGQPDLGSFLSTLNEVSLVTPDAGPVGTTNRNTTVQLRGLPIGTTLTLVNGRRSQASSSASTALVFDLSSIPYAAIEQVDIVPVGSSAIYGGDALAGVVNVILTNSFDGLSLNANLGAGDGTESRGLSLLAGRVFPRGSVMAIGSWSEVTPLSTTERDFFMDADYRRFGGPDARVRQCTPGTVTSASSANLPGLGSTLAGIPDLAPGAPITISSFSATAGAPNLCGAYSEGSGVQLVDESETVSLHLAGEYRLTGAITAFGEATYNQRESYAANNAIVLNNILVPATNAFNPFGVGVRVTTMLDLQNGATGRSRETESTRYLAGLRADLPHDWDFEISAMKARDESASIDYNILISSAARTAALASTDPATALNPFASGRAASETILRGIWDDRPGRVGASERDQLNLLVRGDIGELWGGPINVALGAEAARDSWVTDGTGFVYDTDRTSRAAFAEANIPLLASSNESEARRELIGLSLAARYDDFSDFGDAATYQAGLEIHPTRSLSVRAAQATSFKPPSLLQLHPSPDTFASELFGLRDPRRSNEAIIGADVNFGPNPTLQPETGEARTFGFTWEPHFAPGLRLGATAWEVDIDGLIATLEPQLAVNYEDLFPGLVTRDPGVGGAPGPITAVAYTYVNYGRVSVAGVDFEASYAHDTPLGMMNISAGATRTDSYETQISPAGATQDRAGRRYLDFWAPEWKGRLGVTLDAGPWSLGLAGRYVSSYLDSGVSTQELGDRWTYDVSASVNLLDDRSRLLLTIANLTDELPEFANSAGGYYDATQGDWRGRYGSLRLTVGF